MVEIEAGMRKRHMAAKRAEVSAKKAEQEAEKKQPSTSPVPVAPLVEIEECMAIFKPRPRCFTFMVLFHLPLHMNLFVTHNFLCRRTKMAILM
jgi:hypothetical protein